jgi:hypothetical protein
MNLHTSCNFFSLWKIKLQKLAAEFYTSMQKYQIQILR